MKELAIVVDSACGLDKRQAESLNLFYLPLQIELDGILYNDGVDINTQTFFKHFNLNTKTFKTSATPLGQSKVLIEELSKEYKKVVVFPLSTKLSSQYNTLSVLAREFNNVYVVESVDVAQTILFRLEKFLSELETFGFDKAFKNASIWNNDELDITLLPKYNDYLVKGGRLSKGAATIAKLLQIVPLIRFENGSLEKQGKGRVFLKSVQNVIDEKFESKQNNDEVVILGEHNEDTKTIVLYLESKYKLTPYILPIPNIISVHTGPDAIVIIKGKNLRKLLEKYTK
ncbi:DegV family protein [Mycoplasmopsis edwardii]|uniref:DegV family protein n=1 Tax=Mycoplasmopsis edwardii TaxID=53558 RepID=A0ACD4PH92_9BACT|nr:DegV family protein [Mycoplasmopsis edwardii]WBP84032.1 DegV family protein [Mycoplasmopsis edwardii]